MGDSEKRRDFDIKGLSLIDVSSEDDSLIKSPLCSPLNPQSSEKGSETKTVRFAMDPDKKEISLGSLEEAGKLEEPPDSLEQDKARKNGKYNLRKSLAWDNAFFTSAGVLDPEELSSMLGGKEKGEIHTLPGIEEDVKKSCDSLTTLDSETLTLESLEADLFEDIRASIQKSNKVSNAAISSGKRELKPMDSGTVSSSKKVEFAIQDKMKQKAAPKKPTTIGVKDSGKTLKSVSTVRSVARSRESASSFHRPPKVLSSVGPMSTAPTKRVSLGAKNLKMEKDAKTVTGRGTSVLKTPALAGPRYVVPRPKQSSKSSSCSPASSKTELTTTCSSLESCASASSCSINKSSYNLIKVKNESRILDSSSSGYTITTPSKIASKDKNQAGNSKLSTFLKSSTKLSSSISPSSSISEWSSESSSSTSTVNQRSNSVRASLSSGSHDRKVLPTNCDALLVLDSQNHPAGQCSQGECAEVTGTLDNIVSPETSAGKSVLLHPASMKPSGLRMPSPKIGFFDGVRSSGRTPNGSMLSQPGLPSGLPKIGAKSTNPSGSSNKAKIGKLQPVRTLTAILSPKSDVKQTSSAVKSRSSLSIQKSPNAAAKASSALSIKKSPNAAAKALNASKNPKSSPGKSRPSLSIQKSPNAAATVSSASRNSKSSPGKSRPSLSIPKSPNAAAKVSSAPRNSKSSPGVSPKLQNESSPETGSASYLKARGIGSAEKIVCPGVPKQVGGIGGRDVARKKDTKIVPLDGVPETTADLTSNSDVQNTITSKEAAENETYSHPCVKTDPRFLYNTNKEEAPTEDEISGLIRNSGAVEVAISSDIQKESIADSHVAHGRKEFKNSLSNPTSTSPSPVTSEITSGTRIPFSAKDSFYNMDAPQEILPGPVLAIDKTTTLLVPESILPEKS
ncbi:hypothetical protein DITRI_Ditri12bG0156500 [Diplodiscus trichospermus]